MQSEIFPIAVDGLTSSDLAAEAEQSDLAVMAYRIIIYDDAGITPKPEAAEALWLPSEQRLGIAWGAPASWGSVPSVEQGVELWLNDPERWEALN